MDGTAGHGLRQTVCFKKNYVRACYHYDLKMAPALLEAFKQLCLRKGAIDTNNIDIHPNPRRGDQRGKAPGRILAACAAPASPHQRARRKAVRRPKRPTLTLVATSCH